MDFTPPFGKWLKQRYPQDRSMLLGLEVALKVSELLPTPPAQPGWRAL